MKKGQKIQLFNVPQKIQLFRVAHSLGGQEIKHKVKMDKGNDQAAHSKAHAKTSKSEIDMAHYDGSFFVSAWLAIGWENPDEYINNQKMQIKTARM